jgi:chromosome segregation ATPase
MSKPNEDPFYAVRDDVNGQVDKIKSRYARFNELLRSSDASASAEFKELRKEIGKNLRKVERDIGGLKGAVEQIDKHREKFGHVRDQELMLRKKFVTDMQTSINEIKAGIDSPAVRRKLEEDDLKARNLAAPVSTNDVNLMNNPSGRSSLENENSAFINDQKGRTKQMIRQQDENLEGLSEAVGRLGYMATDINQELKEQNKMLNKLDEDLDDAGNKMNFVMAQLSKLLKTKDGCQIWTIVILAVILILLVCLTIWT